MKYLLFKKGNYSINPLVFMYKEIFSPNGALRKYLPKMQKKDTRSIFEMLKDLAKEEYVETFEFQFNDATEVSLFPQFMNNSNYVQYIQTVRLLCLAGREGEGKILHKINYYTKDGRIVIKLSDFAKRVVSDRAVPDEVSVLVPDPSWGGNKVVYSDTPGKEIIVVDGAEEFWKGEE